jgi:hypothetical protein
MSLELQRHAVLVELQVGEENLLRAVVFYADTRRSADLMAAALREFHNSSRAAEFPAIRHVSTPFTVDRG